jgi:hypothetical protein
VIFVLVRRTIRWDPFRAHPSYACCYSHRSVRLSQESIPIKIVSGAVLVPVRINDRNLNFRLDTGSGSSSIDPSAATELKLTPHGTKRIRKNFREFAE